MRIRRAITRWALLASGLFVFVVSPALQHRHANRVGYFVIALTLAAALR